MPRKRPKKLFTLDTETYNGLKGVLKRIAIYDGVDVIYGYTFEDVERVLKSSYKDGYKPIVYIHNLEFDARKIPSIFNKRFLYCSTIILRFAISFSKCLRLQIPIAA